MVYSSTNLVMSFLKDIFKVESLSRKQQTKMELASNKLWDDVNLGDYLNMQAKKYRLPKLPVEAYAHCQLNAG